MVKLQNPSNACVRLEFSDCIMLTDPWFTKGIYEGALCNFPPVSDPEKVTKDITHLFISHIHEDHWDLNIIRTLNKNIEILLPDIFPNHLMKNKLIEEGFDNIIMVPLESPINVSEKVTLEVIPPMNGYAQEFAMYSENAERPVMAIDCGFILNDREVKIVLLCDNSPYNPKSAGTSFERMKNADLLAFPFNGAAMDYPLCYDFPEKEILTLSNEREARREKANLAFFKMVSPKLTMPYSADWALMGPLAEKYCDIFENEFWFTKKQAANHYEQNHNIPSTCLLEGDVLCLDKKGHVFESKREDFPIMREFLHENYNERPVTKDLYPTSSPYEIIKEKVGTAAKNMFLMMEKHGLQSEWMFAIELLDSDSPPFFIDFATQRICETLDPNRKTLTCMLDPGYLEALLDHRSHWNNAHTSFQLKWKRVPNEYDTNLYGGLIFFHLPIKKKTSVKIAVYETQNA